MFCPECGRELPAGASFCPGCGRNVAVSGNGTDYQYYSYQQPRYNGQAKKNGFTKLIAFIIVSALVVGIFFGMVPGPQPEVVPGENYIIDPDTGAVDSSEDRRAVFETDGFTKYGQDLATLTYTDNPRPTPTMEKVVWISLTDYVRDQYDSIMWVPECHSGSDPDGVWWHSDDGYECFIDTSNCADYTFTAFCRNTETFDSDSFEMSFSIKNLSKFEWKYKGDDYSFEIYIDGEDLKAWTPTKGSAEFKARQPADWTTMTSFAEDKCGYVAATEQKLEELYIKAHGSVSKDQDFANFILGFVQCCIVYENDSVLYDTSEYYAYPIQTLASGKGDCEDTSLLCASLYRTAGYRAAILYLPEHMMAGVHLDEYVSPTLGYNGEIIYQKVGGTGYYACETTLEVFQQVGVSARSASYGWYSDYLTKGLIGFGAYTFYEVTHV